ncbi:MAG: phosphate signaling complex protein PhoU [Rhodospirillaceae bacterium]
MERQHFEEELRDTRACIARMGALVCGRLETCLRALSGHDRDAARFVLDHDEEINALQIEVDERALRLLALQQPAARDLRFITAAVKANADLERIGDQAVNVAGTALELIGRPDLAHGPMVIEMGRNALAMVRDALASFLDRNAGLARSVLERDDEIDAAKRHVLRELIALMTRDPGTIERAVSLIFISRSFERVADHATNMAEDAIFLVEAKDVRHHHP